MNYCLIIVYSTKYSLLIYFFILWISQITDILTIQMLSGQLHWSTCPWSTTTSLFMDLQLQVFSSSLFLALLISCLTSNPTSPVTFGPVQQLLFQQRRFRCLLAANTRHAASSLVGSFSFKLVKGPDQNGNAPHNHLILNENASQTGFQTETRDTGSRSVPQTPGSLPTGVRGLSRHLLEPQ